VKVLPRTLISFPIRVHGAEKQLRHVPPEESHGADTFTSSSVITRPHAARNSRLSMISWVIALMRDDWTMREPARMSTPSMFNFTATISASPSAL
jgi:hypothetical protein